MGCACKTAALLVRPGCDKVLALGRAELTAHFPVSLGNKRPNRLLGSYNERERGGLHATQRVQHSLSVASAATLHCHCARCIHSNEPVGFGTAARGVCQRVVLR